MSRRESEFEDVLSNAEVNLALFEGLFGAKRARLADDLCGLTQGDALHGSFVGHDHFDDEELWEAHYQGPDFCCDLSKMYQAEERLAERGWQRRYIEQLMSEARIDYQGPTTREGVLDFWYALVHINPLRRARAAARVICHASATGAWALSKTTDPAALERDVLRAIELALPIADADADDKTPAAVPFLDFIGGLTPERAEDLIAVMYLGRGDHSHFAAMRRVVAGWGRDRNTLARQMVGKVPLARFLRDGLAKLQNEQLGRSGR